MKQCCTNTGVWHSAHVYIVEQCYKTVTIHNGSNSNKMTDKNHLWWRRLFHWNVSRTDKGHFKKQNMLHQKNRFNLTVRVWLCGSEQYIVPIPHVIVTICSVRMTWWEFLSWVCEIFDPALMFTAHVTLVHVQWNAENKPISLQNHLTTKPSQYKDDVHIALYCPFQCK